MYHHRRMSALFLSLTLICSFIVTTPLETAEAATVPRFEKTKCKDTVAIVTEQCGYLYVPGDHSNPESSGVFKLYVMILNSRSAKPKSDPIFYLEGGPGGAATFTADRWVRLPFLVNRTMVLMDQRGAGYSEPSLNCPELEGQFGSYYREMGECYDRLISDGIDPSLFNSAQSAADVEALRKVLKYDMINLYGISYGTRLALTVMRDFPDHIRSAVLDSVYPPHISHYSDLGPNTVAVIERLLTGCEEDSRCNRAFPTLRDDFFDMLERLNKKSAQVEYDDEKLVINSSDVIDIIFDTLYVSSAIKRLPLAISKAAEDNFEPLIELGFQYGYLRAYPGEYPGGRPRLQDDPDLSDSEGLYFSVECAEEIPFDSESNAEKLIGELPKVWQRALLDSNEQSFRMCNVWKVDETDEIEAEPVESDIPSLLMAGEYDPITPPGWTQAAADYLPEGFYFEYPSLGHGVSVDHSCPLDMTVKFLNAPTKEPSDTCITSMRAPRWAIK